MRNAAKKWNMSTEHYAVLQHVDAIDLEIHSLRLRRSFIKRDYKGWAELYFGLRAKRSVLLYRLKELDEKAEDEYHAAKRLKREVEFDPPIKRGPLPFSQEELLEKFEFAHLKELFPLDVATRQAYWLRAQSIYRRRSLTNETYGQLAIIYKCSVARISQIIIKVESEIACKKSSPVEQYFRGRTDTIKLSNKVRRNMLCKVNVTIRLLINPLINEMG